MSRFVRIVVAVVVLLAGARVVEAAAPKVIGTVTLTGRPGLEGIPIVAFAWSTRTVFTTGAGGTAAGKLAFDDFRVTKLLDATSPAIYALEAAGTTTGEVRVDATIRRGTTVSYVLSEATIVTNQRRTPDGNGPPLQEIGFSARAIRETVTGPGGSVTTCFDLVAVGACQ